MYSWRTKDTQKGFTVFIKSFSGKDFIIFLLNDNECYCWPYAKSKTHKLKKRVDKYIAAEDLEPTK